MCYLPRCAIIASASPCGGIDPRFANAGTRNRVLSAWAASLVFIGDFYADADKRLYDVLSDYCIFGAVLFYLAAVLSVFVLRLRGLTCRAPIGLGAIPGCWRFSS